jgi:translation elongation factor EF-1alpha
LYPPWTPYVHRPGHRVKPPCQIENGYALELDYHTAKINDKFNKICSKIDKRTDKSTEAEPSCIKIEDAAKVQLIRSLWSLRSSPHTSSRALRRQSHETDRCRRCHQGDHP